MGILDFGFSDFGDFGFWDFGDFGLWILGVLGILDFGILGILDFGDFGFWGFWILGILGILDFWDFGILGRSRGCTTRQLVTVPGGQRLAWIVFYSWDHPSKISSIGKRWGSPLLRMWDISFEPSQYKDLTSEVARHSHGPKSMGETCSLIVVDGSEIPNNHLGWC